MSNINTFLKQNIFNIFFIFFIFLVAFVVAMKIYLPYNNVKFQKEFKENRCNPLWGLMAGSSDEYKGKSKIDAIHLNYNYCMYPLQHKFFQILISPFNQMFQIIHVIISDIKNTINKFRIFIKWMKGMINNYIKKLMNRLENTYASILYVFVKTKAVIDKMQGSYDVVNYILWTIFKMMTFIANAIIDILIDFCWICIGILAGILFLVFFWALPLVIYFAAMLGIHTSICFDENTIINLKGKGKVTISQVEPGNILSDGARIISKIKVLRNNTLMYNYKGVLVTGNHLVYDDSMMKWLRIENTKEAYIDYSYNKPFLYCLETETNKININDICFRDFNELNEKQILTEIDNIILNKLNNTNTNPLSDNDNCIKGFTKFNKVKLKDDRILNFHELAIGDILENNSKVLGIVSSIIDIKDIELYKYLYKNMNPITVSGSVIIKENDQWIKLKNSKYASKICEDDLEYWLKKVEIFNIFTDSNIISIDNILFRDYLEISDHFTTVKINKMVEDYLNYN